MTAEVLLSQALADMKARQGVTIADLTPGELVALVRACEKVASPFDEVNADAAGLPVRVCDGVWFWRLTVGASIWLDNADKLLGGKRFDPRYRLALVYACRYARRSDMLNGCDTIRDLTRTVRNGLSDIDATADEVDAALDVVLGVKARPPAGGDEIKKAATNWTKLCARLETQTGIPAREWIWNRSGAYLVKCYNDLHEFARAYSVAKSSSSEYMLDELDEAVNTLQVLKVNIMRRVRNV